MTTRLPARPSRGAARLLAGVGAAIALVSVVSKFDGLMFKRSDGRKASMECNGR